MIFDMGSLGGHVIPGAFFVFYGLVWITMSFWLYLTTPSKSPSNPKGKGGSTTTTYLGYKREVRLGRLSYIPQSFLPKVPMEPIIKIFLSSLGIIVEAFFVENNGKVRFSVVKLYLPDGSFGGVSKIPPYYNVWVVPSVRDCRPCWFDCSSAKEFHQDVLLYYICD